MVPAVVNMVITARGDICQEEMEWVRKDSDQELEEVQVSAMDLISRDL